MTISVTITLPESIFLRNVGGVKQVLDVTKLPESVIGPIFETGAKTVLTNAFNGGGSAATDAEKLAAMQKKIAAWERGEFNVVTRGESGMSMLREQYIDERREATGATRGAVEKAIKSAVQDTFGKDEPATFGRFLDAVAAAKCKADASLVLADYRDAIEIALSERAEAAAAKRAKAGAKLDVTDLGF